VVLPGLAVAIQASRFRSALCESPKLRAVCEAYAQGFVAHLLQNVACTAAHTVEERCARWLLMCGDQTEDDAFELTQEYLAEMLGVRRSTVTVVAGTLQKAGLICYRRGAITVLDRRGLEAAACECYRIIRERYERVLAPSADEAVSTRRPSLAASEAVSATALVRPLEVEAQHATLQQRWLASRPCFDRSGGSSTAPAPIGTA
jgi:hypothetical protein